MSPSSDPTKLYVIEISSNTAFKEGDKKIQWTDLKPGDSVQVSSLKGGSKIHAAEIVRLPKDETAQD